MGNAAAVLSGAWGAVTRRSEQSGSSRTALYTHAERVVQAVASEQARGISYEALWAQNKQLQAENEALWHAWGEAETLSESKQRELASAGSAMGLSLTQIVTLLAIVLPMAVVPSRATVGRWVPQSAEQARRLLRVLDRACQRWVLTGCLDDIFLHRAPILMAVEPMSLAWVAGQRGPDRRGASWREVIEPWPSLEHVIADGGTGLENGVKLANERRRVQAQDRGGEPGPALTMGLDVLHSQREMERVLQRQWKQVERQVAEASEADTKVAQYKRRGRDARGVAGRAGRAWRKAERLFDEAVHVEEAVRQIETALVWFEADGQLLSRGTAQQQLDKASEKLSGSQWSQVRRWLQDERSLRHVDRLEKQRAEGGAEPQLREALTRLWVLSERLKHAQDEEVGRWGALVAMDQVLCGRLCPSGRRSLGRWMSC